LRRCAPKRKRQSPTTNLKMRARPRKARFDWRKTPPSEMNYWT
jgi:hypothetical protein